MDLWLADVAIGIVVCLALHVAFGARRESRALAARLRTLDTEVGMLGYRLEQLAEQRGGTAEPAPVADPPPAAAPVVASTPPPAFDHPTSAAAETAEPPVVAARQIDSSPFRMSERWLAENALVWLGGIALALGGAFLVRLSIEHGLLTPPVRVLLGMLLGGAMTASGDRIARKERSAERAGGASASYVAQALVAAGAATVFASLYAAHALYQLLPAGLAFPLLAAAAAGSVAMSLRHGPFVAALGLCGAFAVPLLVQGDTPGAPPLFAYLAVVVAASLALLRHRAWPWLAWISLAGSLGWTALWLLRAGDHPETPVVGAFLLALLALFAAFRRGVPAIPFLAGVADRPIVRQLTRAAIWSIAAALWTLAQADGYGDMGLACALVASAFVLWLGYRDPDLDDVILAAAVLPLALLATWPISEGLPIPDQLAATAALAAAMLGAGGFAAIGGFAAAYRAPRPARWAALSAASPLAALAIVYGRLHEHHWGSGGLDWPLLALALAGLALAAAARIARLRPGDANLAPALAAYAVAVLGGTILAATMALSEAWLTVALALHLPALGWVDRQVQGEGEGGVRLPVLRRIALGIAAAVLVRLAINPELLSYPLSATPIFNWLLYGYGVPAAAFVVAARQFARSGDDVLVSVLEAGGIAFTVLLLTLELQHALYGTLHLGRHTLARDAAFPILWLSLAAGLLRAAGLPRAANRGERPVLLWAGVALFAVATLDVLAGQVLATNPLATGESVGRWLLLDTVTLAYGLPAILYAMFPLLRLGPVPVQRFGRGLSFGLALLWLTLETRHVFRGEILTASTISEAEWYAYSAVWLGFFGASLAAALRWKLDWLRLASLGGIGLVAAKVFLTDTSELAGIWRALSYFGLGGALIGIGYAYRRLRPDPADRTAL